MTADLVALAERVEALDGPDETLDAEICIATGALSDVRFYPFPVHGEPYWEGRDRDGGPASVEPYTASLDAVAALIAEKLPGWAWRVGTCCVSDDGWVVPDFNCPVHGERLHKQFGGFSAGSLEDTGIDIDRRPSGQPVLALLAAFIRGYALHTAALRALGE